MDVTELIDVVDPDCLEVEWLTTMIKASTIICRLLVGEAVARVMAPRSGSSYSGTWHAPGDKGQGEQVPRQM